MSKAIKLILSLLSINLLNAQDYNLPDLDNYCKRSEVFKENLIYQKVIDQSPLLHHYDIKFYFLDLNVENNSVDISGNVTFYAQVIVNELDTFAFELVDELLIDSVFINGLQQPFLRDNNEVFVIPENPLLKETNFTCQVYYHGTPPTSGYYTGIKTKYDTTWNKHVTWTLSEPFNARQWWPTKQVLTDKADSVWVFLTTSDENKAGSIGLLTNVVSLPNNRIRYEWKSQYPIAYYLISFAVADYQEYNIYAKPADLLGDSLLIQNYIYDAPGCLSYHKQGIDNTVGFLELFSELFSKYPFHQEKYGHCLAGLNGGMEHQTMTTIGSFNFSLVAHELGHMWFGDNVTCSNWSDIWINEGFATYADYLATEKIAGGQYPGIWRKNAHNFIMSEPGGSIYVPDEDVTYDNVKRIFNSRLTYWKGAVILHMIRFELQNDELFFDVLRNFQEKYADSSASTPDFIEVLNEISGKKFGEFFNQWYYGEGYPVYNVSYNQSGGFLEIESAQTTSMPDVTPIFKMHIPFKLFFNDGTDSTIIIYQENNFMSYTISVTKYIDSIQVDPDRWILKRVESVSEVPEIDMNAYFSLSPNPVSDELLIRSYSEWIYKVTIHDLFGNKISDYSFMQPMSVIDVSGLSCGVYFISLQIGDTNFTRKFVKF